jgi:ribonuclease T1
VLRALAAVLLLAFVGGAAAFSKTGEVRVAELPPEARQTLALIRKGGPFPYSKDGTTFGNRERILPAKAHGYYREYTVKTPGSRDRGARRIVAGHGKSAEPVAGEIYYTDDHYRSFRRILE